MQVPFVYDAHSIRALRSSVSPERLLRYQAAAAGDDARALGLYMWNVSLSESLYGPIQGFEITLRNKIHTRFAAQFGLSWYDVSAVELEFAQRDQVSRAKQSLRQQRKPLDPPRVVAELSFGFWAGLFGRRYENHLWRPHLRCLFINARPPFLRRDAHKVLDGVRLLRNRIAHHEPILHRPLLQDYESILTAIGWLCPDTAAWVDYHSRFNAIYRSQA